MHRGRRACCCKSRLNFFAQISRGSEEPHNEKDNEGPTRVLGFCDFCELERTRRLFHGCLLLLLLSWAPLDTKVRFSRMSSAATAWCPPGGPHTFAILSSSAPACPIATTFSALFVHLVKSRDNGGPTPPEQAFKSLRSKNLGLKHGSLTFLLSPTYWYVLHCALKKSAPKRKACMHELFVPSREFFFKACIILTTNF